MISSNIDIENIHINKPDVKPAKKDINQVIDRLREQTAVWEACKGPARIGDKVMVEYRVTSNGRVIEDTTGKPTEHELRTENTRDAPGSMLVGRLGGERLEFTVRRTGSRNTSSRYRTPGKYAACISGILRKNERKSRQALAALFGRKTVRQDTLYREVEQTMLARLDLLVRNEVKNQVFNALYSGTGEERDDPCFKVTVDPAQHREVMARRIQDLVHKHEVNLDYDRVLRIVSALAEKSADPESAERKFHNNTELLSRIEAAVLEDQIVEFILERASVKSSPVQYQNFIASAANLPVPEPGHDSPNSLFVELTSDTKCGYCTNSKCCQYITQRIPAPRSKADFSYLLWQLSHENISIFKDEEGWHMLVTTRCSHLQSGGRCGIYASRPEICRVYKNDYCEFEGPAEEGYQLCFHDYEELLDYCQKRFKRWDDYTAGL
jgi:Fe-S-cluster containining protein